jgi:protein-tyrosine-phosphatase
MAEQQPFILIVGGADTGRAPITAALLQQRLAQAGYTWVIESAGVVGHDGDPAEPEAHHALMQFGLDISLHRARSLSANLAAAADVLLAVDQGTAHVARTHYPEVADRILTLGQLSGHQRDIPDLFRMQVGAWVLYAREIDEMLAADMEQLIALAAGEDESATTDATPQAADATATPLALAPDERPDTAPHSANGRPNGAERQAAVERCERLLTVMRDMPDLVPWPQARQQLATEIKAASTISLGPDDLVQAYASLLLALLEMRATPPGAEQCRLLAAVIGRLREPINQHALTELSSNLSGWTAA